MDQLKRWSASTSLTDMSDYGLAYRMLILALVCRTKDDPDAHVALAEMASEVNKRWGS